MSIRRLIQILFSIIVLISAITCPASAVPIGTVEIEHTGYGASGLLRVWGGGLHGSRVHGGVYMLDKTGDTGQGDNWNNGPLGVFCIELSQRTPIKPYEYNVVMPEEAQSPPYFLGGPIGQDKAEYLAELWGRFYDPNWVGFGPFTFQQNRKAEAFAAAVWEIVYEDLPASPANWNVMFDGTIGHRGFRCSGVDTYTANQWLHALDGTGPKADLWALVHRCKQDFIVDTCIPEPATICLLGFGTLLLGQNRKSNKK
jgi:hypothetical protein